MTFSNVTFVSPPRFAAFTTASLNSFGVEISLNSDPFKFTSTAPSIPDLPLIFISLSTSTFLVGLPKPPDLAMPTPAVIPFTTFATSLTVNFSPFAILEAEVTIALPKPQADAPVIITFAAFVSSGFAALTPFATFPDFAAPPKKGSNVAASMAKLRPNCQPAPLVPRVLSAEYLANELATPVAVDATFAPGTKAKPREATSPKKPSRSLVSAVVQLSDPISLKLDAFLGSLTLD